MLAAAGRRQPRLTLVDARGAAVESIWRDLEAQAAPSYFLSWGWVDNWLACLLPSERPSLALVRDGGVVVAAFFLGRARLRRHGVLPSRGLFLNATGSERLDALRIEHNAVLCAPRARLTLAALLEQLPGNWDELYLPGLARDLFPGCALDEPLPDGRLLIDEELEAPFVDLARVRAHHGDYLGLLGANTRAQIRRAQRRFGALTVEVAGDVCQAYEIYEELGQLHGARWRRAGQPGAFADPWFDGFHRRLIGTRFAHGELQLIRVRARGATIGCLYNFVSRGRVLFYQSGLVQLDDPQLKPGYVCHAEAVRHNAAAGHAVYDLLGGDGRYKQCLATDATRLVWARVQRPRARFAVEDRLRQCKRALVGVARRACGGRS